MLKTFETLCGIWKWSVLQPPFMALDLWQARGISTVQKYKMLKESLAPRVTAAADLTLENSGIRHNPYLQALQDGSMRLEGFRRSQEQFFFAVTFFPRPMAALVGRIPSP